MEMRRGERGWRKRHASVDIRTCERQLCVATAGIDELLNVGH
jgi:hypothetical protein